MLTIIPSTEVPPHDPMALEGLLGPFLPQPPALVLISGETSAGKTVLSYNLAYHIAEGREFIGLTPTASLRVLYIDLESPEQLHRHFVERIGRSDKLAFVRDMPRKLYLHDGQGDLTRAIVDWGAKFVVIDPLAMAWPSRDENDNAEADAQMSKLKEIAVGTDTVVVVLWNMGEAPVRARFRARGATARVDRADQALNYLEVSETTRRLEIVKSRYGYMGRRITVRFAGDYGFEAVAGVDMSPPSQTQVIEAFIVNLVSQRPHTRQELLAALKRVDITNENLVDKALGALRSTGKVTSPERGMYALPGSSDPQ